jgi:hypothetical protein
MAKRYVVRLTEEERIQLGELVSKGKAAAYKIRHANILLLTDASGPAWSDQQVAQALHCHVNTVANVRQRLVEHGLAVAVERKSRARPARQPVCDGAAEAKLIALRCSPPPPGQAKWTLKLLADRMVELKIVPTISYETVRQVLKKTSCGLTCESSMSFHRRKVPSL